MDIDTIRKGAASEAINKTISMVEEALNMKFQRVATPSESREIMIDGLKELRDDATAKPEDAIGWGSPVILKGARKPPVWVESVDGGLDWDDGWMTMTPEFERTVDKVAKHLRNWRLVNWGNAGLRDEQIRRLILVFDKVYREQNPSFSGTKWDVQPPAYWKVFYVLGMDDFDDQHTARRVLDAIVAGKRIIDIRGGAPSDLTDAYMWAWNKLLSTED